MQHTGNQEQWHVEFNNQTQQKQSTVKIIEMSLHKVSGRSADMADRIGPYHCRVCRRLCPNTLAAQMRKGYNNRLWTAGNEFVKVDVSG